MESTQYSRIILRSHAAFLLALTFYLLIASTVGSFAGTGQFAWLEENPFAHLGLFQAYALMMLIGIVLWVGSYDAVPFKWDVIGLLAHAAPLAMNFMYAAELDALGTPSTVALHSFFILLEGSVLLRAWVTRAKPAATA